MAAPIKSVLPASKPRTAPRTGQQRLQGHARRTCRSCWVADPRGVIAPGPRLRGWPDRDTGARMASRHLPLAWSQVSFELAVVDFQ